MSLGLSRTRNRPRVAPGYRLGDPIALEDLLALPRDGERYGRDAAGRLTIMSPESASRHMRPIARLLCWLNRELPAAFEAVQEPSLAFPRIWALKGQRLLPESRIGRKAIEPDIAVFSRRPDVVQGNPEPEPMRWETCSSPAPCAWWWSSSRPPPGARTWAWAAPTASTAGAPTCRTACPSTGP